MRKYKIKQYSILSFLYLIGLIISSLIPSLILIERNITNEYVLFSDSQLYLSIMGPTSNYFFLYRIVVLYIIAFVFGLNLIFSKGSPDVIIRQSSRNDYIKRHIIDTIIFTAIFTFLLETVNIVFSFCVFGADLTLSNNLIFYSALDYISEFLYYTRVGFILLLLEVVINKRFAPFLAIGIYAFEAIAIEKILEPYDLWLPYKDSVIVTKLLIANAQPTDIIPIIIRGVIFNTLIILTSYRLFKKKDIIENEKKQ